MTKILNLVYPDKSDIKYQIQRFPDGQQNIVIDPKSLFVPNINETHLISRLNNWLDLELIVATVASLREITTEPINLYVPYILGARSDRKFEEGGNNYIKDVIAPVINYLNFKSVTCIDPHSDVLEACIKGFRKEDNKKLVTFAVRDLYLQEWDGKSKPEDRYILVSPDAGATKKIHKLADKIGYKGDIITCSKDRDTEGKLTKTVVPFKDTGPLCMKDYVIIDDICDGGRTFINIAVELKKAYNCNKIYLIVTHGIFSKGFGELNQYFDGIYCTNSYRDLEFEGILKDKVKQLNVF